MNWTGGSFARHSRNGGSLSCRQKQHFAKVRSALQNRSKAPSPLRLAFARETLRRWRSSVDARSCTSPSHSRGPDPAPSHLSQSRKSRKLHDIPDGPHAQETSLPVLPRPNSVCGDQSFADHPFHAVQRAGGPAPDAVTYTERRKLAPPDRILPDLTEPGTTVSPKEASLEHRKRELLSRHDWVGTNIVRPLRMQYPAPADRCRLAKRRRLGKAAELRLSGPTRTPSRFKLRVIDTRLGQVEEHARAPCAGRVHERRWCETAVQGAAEPGSLHRPLSLVSKSSLPNLTEGANDLNSGFGLPPVGPGTMSYGRESIGDLHMPEDFSESLPDRESLVRTDAGLCHYRDCSLEDAGFVIDPSDQLSFHSNHRRWSPNSLRRAEEHDHDGGCIQSTHSEGAVLPENTFDLDPALLLDRNDSLAVLQSTFLGGGLWQARPAGFTSDPPTPIGADLSFPLTCPRSAPTPAAEDPFSDLASTAATAGEEYDRSWPDQESDETAWEQWLSMTTSSADSHSSEGAQDALVASVEPTKASPNIPEDDSFAGLQEASSVDASDEVRQDPGGSTKLGSYPSPDELKPSDEARHTTPEDGPSLEAHQEALVSPLPQAMDGQRKPFNADDCWKKFVFGDEDDEDEGCNQESPSGQPVNNGRRPLLSSLCVEPSQSSFGLSKVEPRMMLEPTSVISDAEISPESLQATADPLSSYQSTDIDVSRWGALG